MKILEFLAKHATVFLAASVLAGFALPDLAAWLRPALGPIVVANLTTALIRLDFGQVASYSRRPILLSSAITFLLIVSPLLMWAALGGNYLPAGLAAGLILMCAAPPITSAPAFALILGLEAEFSVFVVIASHLLVPLTLPLLALEILGLDIELSFADLMLRLTLLVGGSLALTFLLKRFFLSPAFIARNGKRIEGLSVIGLILFAIAVMDGVAATSLARPELALLTVTTAFAANIGLQIIGSLVYWRSGHRLALTMGHMTGNCNMGLVLATLGDNPPLEVALFFALAQLPMYMLPSVCRPIYRRLLRP